MKTRSLRFSILTTALLVMFASLAEAASVSGSNSGNVNIPDGSPGAWVSSQITISAAPAGATVAGIDVYFRCVHPYSGDLVVDLNADSTGSLGNRNLWNREEGSADNPTRTVSGISTFNGLSVNRTWYLYARDYEAVASGYIDEWTITISYSSDAQVPAAPQILSPGDGSGPGPVLSGLTPTFTWSAVSGASRYGLYISKEPYGPANLVYQNAQVSGTSFVLPGGNLQAGIKYRWAMTSFNSAGQESVNQSAVRYFQAPTEAPPAPQIHSPGDTSGPGPVLSGLTPTFTWSAVSGASRYGLYISKEPYGPANLVYQNAQVSGTSFVLPGGNLEAGIKYRWAMTSFNSAGQESVNQSAVRYFRTSIFDGVFRLAFPLAGYTPFTAPASAVFDHSGSRYSANNEVVAFTGEAGTVKDTTEPAVTVGLQTLFSYRKADGSSFAGNGNYRGTSLTGPSTLNYDGHPGWDYAVGVGTPVYAVADGQVLLVTSDSSSGNYIRLQHDTDYQSQYLHLSEQLVSQGTAVTKGQLIGKSGNSGGVAPHLHFEVKRLVSGTWISVDPYGWTGVGADPYEIVNENLWENASPVTYTIAVSASPSAGGTVIGGGTFAAGSSRTVTATANSGYTFVNWTKDGSLVSSSASYAFALNSNRNLVANFTSTGQRLLGVKIGVDPGHGGTETGAVGPNFGLTEKSVNLATALALKNYLEAEGATVVMTRTTDSNVSLPSRSSLFVNDAVDFAVSVHHNGGVASANSTMVFIYCDRSLATRGAFASAVVQRLGASTGVTISPAPASTLDTLCSGHADWQTGLAGVGQANLHMVREAELQANILSILAEVSFVTNPAEEAKLLDAAYLDRNGWAIYAGIADYFGFTPIPQDYTPPPSEVTATFGGVIADAGTTLPIPEATVSWGLRSTLSDGNGFYSFDQIPCETATLTVSKDGFVTGSETYSPLCLSSSVKNVTLVPDQLTITILSTQFSYSVGSEITIEGIVQDAAGNGVAGVAIAAEDSLFRQSRLVGITGSNGRFSLPYSSGLTTSLGPGLYPVIIAAGKARTAFVINLEPTFPDLFTANTLRLNVGVVGQPMLLTPDTLVFSTRVAGSTIPVVTDAQVLDSAMKLVRETSIWLAKNHPVEGVAFVGALVTCPFPSPATTPVCGGLVTFLFKSAGRELAVAAGHAMLDQLAEGRYTLEQKEEAHQFLDRVALGISLLGLKPNGGLVDDLELFSTAWDTSRATMEMVRSPSGELVGLNLVGVGANGMETRGLACRMPPTEAVEDHAIVVTAAQLDGGVVSGDGVYPDGANVTVVASPKPGFTFVSWTEGEGGPLVSPLPNYTFSATTDRALVANFEPAASLCIDAYEPNESSLSGAPLPLGVDIRGRICTATDVDWFKVNVTQAGTLNISLVVPQGNDYDLELYGPNAQWRSGGYLNVGMEERIAYRANDTGTYFLRVYGAPEGNGSFNTTESYTLSARLSDGATFTLTVRSANGSVTITPDLQDYTVGSSVMLTPIPAAGYQFTGWSGDHAGTENPLEVLMDANKTITATFALAPANTGSIRITVVPHSAAEAGARWRIVGDTAWRKSGTIFGELPIGTYQVEFEQIPGWVTPPNKEVTIAVVTPDPQINSDPYFLTVHEEQLPRVFISLSDSTASESGIDIGAFTVTRSVVSTGALTVAYTLGGTAGNGVDYEPLTGTATIAAGSASVDVSVVPKDDAVQESTESVVLTLAPNSAYVIGSPNSATVNIIDNDSPTTGGGDSRAPTVAFITPNGSPFRVNVETILLQGMAYDDIGISRVAWSNDRDPGGGGDANLHVEEPGKVVWSVSSVTLKEGSNVIRVTAYDTSGKSGSATRTVIATLPSSELVPPVISASDGTYSDRVHVTWESDQGSRFELWRSDSEDFNSAAKIIEVSVGFYNDVFATPGKTYWYWVRSAVNPPEWSGFSAPDSGWREVPPFSRLTISGPTFVFKQNSGQFTATAIFADATSQTSETVSATWSVDPPVAAISNEGLLSVGELAADTIVDVTASFTLDGVMRTASKTVLLRASEESRFVVPTQYSTIQAAIDAAQSGDTVQVLPGEYNERITLKAGVTLQGSGADRTKIKATSGETVVTMAANSTLDGFTIDNVNRFVGGIACNVPATISNNVIYGSLGIGQSSGKCFVKNNVIICISGPAISLSNNCSSCEPLLVDIENNTIAGNGSPGLFLQGGVGFPSTINVRNNIFTGKQAAYADNHGDATVQHLFLSYNLYWNIPNISAMFYRQVSLGTGDINSVDPLFVDAANNNFRLRAGSPAINSGDTDATYNDLDGTRNDRGAYGGPTLKVGGKIEQSISFPGIVGKTFGDTPFEIEATATSQLPVKFAVISGPATIDGHSMTLTGAGTVVISASQSGDDSFYPAPDVTASIIVAKADQTISFGTLAPRTLGDAPFTVSATASSGLPVAFSVESGPARIDGSTVTVTAAGTVVVRASQFGNANYNEAQPPVDQSFNVAEPPSIDISAQPKSQTVIEGQTVIFHVVATGSGEFSYQWKRNGADLAGQTDSTLTLNNVDENEAGDYTVVVSTSVSSLTSDVAELTVTSAPVAVVAPSIVTQPAAATVIAGGNATLIVVATGDVPLTYQWKLNGVDLAGRSNASLTLNDVQVSDVGNYTVVVRNSGGFVTSDVATLTVHYSLSATALGGGTVTKSPEQENYPPGSSVVLTATPSIGYQFSHWTGDATGVETPATVTMDRNKTITANFVLTEVQTQTLSDDFNRPDSSTPGNGWLVATDNVGSPLGIVSQRLSSTGVESKAIYRPFAAADEVELSAVITHRNGFGCLPLAYSTAFAIHNDGTMLGGYWIQFSRSDRNYNDSAISLWDDGVAVGSVTPSFQFGESVTVDYVRFKTDGSVQGRISQAGTSFAFAFGPRQISSHGSNVSIFIAGPDGRCGSLIYGTVDDFRISSSGLATQPGNNTAPTISEIDDQSTLIGTQMTPIAFTVTDADTLARNLIISTSSSNPVLVPKASIQICRLAGSGAIIVHPAPEQTGVATISISVSDGDLSSSESFALTVIPGEPPDPGSAQLAPCLQLTDLEQRGDVTEARTEILNLVLSGAPLTHDEKGFIGGIMLTKANVYNFTEDERVAIFEALTGETASIPTVTVQPETTSAVEGANVTFIVEATGTAPLNFQWRKDGAFLTGATSATLTLQSVSPDDAGSYSVFVSNDTGSIISADALLTVIEKFGIAGIAKYYSGDRNVPAVTFALTGNAQDSVISGTDGSYDFAVNSGGNYMVQAAKTNDQPPSQGVTTLDIALLRRHILALERLDSPFKELAGDVNDSASITTFDISLIRRLILGIADSFPGGSLWRFVRSDFEFDPLNIWSVESSRTYSSLSADARDQNFVGIKFGDVNGSWKPPTTIATASSENRAIPTVKSLGAPTLGPGEHLSKPVVRIAVGRASQRGGGLVEIPIRARTVPALTTLQFTAEWDAGRYRYVGIGDTGGLSGFDGENIGKAWASAGKLPISWDSPDGTGVNVPEGASLFSVLLEPIVGEAAGTPIRISDEPTVREASVGFELAELRIENESPDADGPVAPLIWLSAEIARAGVVLQVQTIQTKNGGLAERNERSRKE